jgi:hypothetical protein
MGARRGLGPREERGPQIEAFARRHDDTRPPAQRGAGPLAGMARRAVR